MAEEMPNRTKELEQELAAIQAELAAMELKPTIERPRFEALKRRVEVFQKKLAARSQRS